jgi:hypothetical protein
MEQIWNILVTSNQQARELAGRNKEQPDMMSALVSILFAATLCLALGAIVATWRSYGTDVLSLHQQLAACDGLRELRFVTITTQVRQESADLWRPGFRPLAAQIQARRSQHRPELRAAA